MKKWLHFSIFVFVFVTGVCLLRSAFSEEFRVAACARDAYMCGDGPTYVCCQNTQKCCSYTGTDNQVWYTCRPVDSECPR